MRTSALVSLALIVSSAPAFGAELRTTQCRQYDQPEIAFQVKSAAIPAPDPQWVIETLETMVASGSRFKPGDTLQLGWMINQFAAGPDGTLRLQEPDMRSMPTAFVDQLDNTLRHLRSQKDAAGSFTEPLEVTFPSIRQSIFVPPAYKTIFRYAIQRHKPDRHGLRLADDRPGATHSRCGSLAAHSSVALTSSYARDRSFFRFSRCRPVC